MRTRGDTSAACAAHEFVVDGLLLRFVRGGVLGMPLRTHHPRRGWQLHGLELAVGRPAARHQWLGKVAEALVVHRVAVLEIGGAGGERQLRARRESHRVLAHPVVAVADVLYQGAAERDVQHLHAAAQREHRQIELDGGEAHRDVEIVVRRHDAVQGVVVGLLAVPARVDVAAARQQHTVEVLQHGEGVLRELLDGRHQHRDATGSRHRAAVGLAAAECVALALVGERERASAERDQGRRSAHRPHSVRTAPATLQPVPEMLVLRNPATEEVIRELPHATVDDVDAAVAKAKAAGPAWRAVSPADRSRLLRRFADKVADHVEELALLETQNMGMPIGSARWCANAVSDVLHYFAGAVEKHTGSSIPVAGGIDVTFHEPLGVVGLITPWNFPMLMASWKIGPALAAGNTAVLKPAEITPLTSMRLGELALEAGIPEGVLNVVVGPGATVGWRLVEHPDVRKVAFTGSTAVGKRLMQGCADQVKRLTLELGGKSANIVFADADLEKAAASAPGAVFDNSGQDCCARSRVLVQRSVYDRFMPLFIDAAKAFTVGDPMDPATAMGPLVTADHLARVRKYTDGLDTVFTGDAPSGPGYWHPVMIATPEYDHPVCHEEVFGPLVVVIPFDDEADAIRICNDSDYGLSGSVWTQDGAKAIRVVRAMEAGTLSVNSNSSVRYSTPFGGFKQSGLGREHSMHVLDHYTELKNVFFAT
jgi:acyl-CoA reductase-like NAD-dependent aldehyde dehydrogenase